MVVTVTLKDGKKQKHEVSLWVGEEVVLDPDQQVADETLAELARGNLRKYADAGTTKLQEPLELVGVVRAEDPA